MTEALLGDFETTRRKYSSRAERALKARLIDGSVTPERLHEAMNYTALGGGKRFRAMVVYACGEAAGAHLEQLDTPASAVEMIHAYSLVHDDLPAMDDDVLRRGRPTCHIEFDDAAAILAGDALQSRAFEILASEKWNVVDPGQKIRMVEVLAGASGSMGMAGGQALDVQATGRSIDYRDLVRMHKMKTGALIKASAVMGALACKDVDEQCIADFGVYGQFLGLAFQVSDDVLDHTADSETLGKTSGADEKMNKATYVSLLGLDAAMAEAKVLSERAVESIQGLRDNGRFLEQLAEFVVTRSY